MVIKGIRKKSLIIKFCFTPNKNKSCPVFGGSFIFKELINVLLFFP